MDEFHLGIIQVFKERGIEALQRADGRVAATEFFSYLLDKYCPGQIDFEGEFAAWWQEHQHEYPIRR